MAKRDGPATRDRFLTATEALLRERGMHGAGIQAIVARSGAPIGSLYHYFPAGKTQLVAEAIDAHAAKFPELVERYFDERRSASAAVRALFDNAADVFEHAGADKGCAIGAVALDVTSDDAEVRALCQRAFEGWVDAIAPRLPFPDERARRSFASVIVIALEGAFVLARAARSGEPFRDAGRWLSASLREKDP